MRERRKKYELAQEVRDDEEKVWKLCAACSGGENTKEFPHQM